MIHLSLGAPRATTFPGFSEVILVCKGQKRALPNFSGLIAPLMDEEEEEEATLLL